MNVPGRVALAGRLPSGTTAGAPAHRGADVRAAAAVLLATAGIVAQQVHHAPLQLPGHRGLVWLALLIAARLGSGRPGAATAAGTMSGAAILVLGAHPAGPVGIVPYVAAGLLVDALATTAPLHRRPWLLAFAAVPIHLVALVVPFSRSLRVGVTPAALLEGMETVIWLHVAFGLGAGLLGCWLGLTWRRASRARR